MELGEFDGDVVDLVLSQDRPVMGADAFVQIPGRCDVKGGIHPYRRSAGEHDHREKRLFRTAGIRLIC